MTIGETIRKAIKEISNGILGLMVPKNFRLDDDDCCQGKCKPKRARTKKGKYKADDKSTPDVNEAYVGGKAPTRKDLLGLKKKKAKRKTKRKK
tara:strand:- start:793 stop:1071 length:279 start_codon:yes stop_codon:yes gene_type:complete